jgi:hypothetical protein
MSRRRKGLADQVFGRRGKRGRRGTLAGGGLGSSAFEKAVGKRRARRSSFGDALGRWLNKTTPIEHATGEDFSGDRQARREASEALDHARRQQAAGFGSGGFIEWARGIFRQIVRDDDDPR